MRLYLFGLLRSTIPTWESSEKSRMNGPRICTKYFLGTLHGKYFSNRKRSSPGFVHIFFLIMPSPTFAISIFNSDMIKFQLTTPTMVKYGPMYETKTPQYLQHRNTKNTPLCLCFFVEKWQMIGLLHPQVVFALLNLLFIEPRGGGNIVDSC